MAKRKKKKAPADPYIEGLGSHITIGTWKGIPNYECVHCTHATPTPIRAWEHFKSVHLESPTRATVDTGLVTTSGEPLLRDVKKEPADDKRAEPAKED